MTEDYASFWNRRFAETWDEAASLRAENERLWKFVESRPCDCHDEYDKGPQQCDRCYLLLGRE